MNHDFITSLKYGENGLVPVIAQDYKTGAVLMLAYANEEALRKSIETKTAHYFSRSRNELWKKGGTSSHIQHILDIRYDCDMDAVLYIVEQIGAACHTGEKTCFYRSAYSSETTSKTGDSDILTALAELVAHRRDNPKEKSYTNYLLDKGNDKILKKIGEEASEVIIAVKNGNKTEITCEAADLMYHLTVCLVNNGLAWGDIFTELEKR